MTVPTITLNDQTTIPQLGFGVFQVPPEETAATVTKAFEAGYRHIDTAQMYGNEQGVGDAIAASGIARDELYVTTKLNNGFHRPDDAARELAASLERLQLDRVDLVLIHWPLPTRYDGDYVSTWQALIDFQKAGGATSIGVSNFQPDHLERIIGETGVVPVGEPGRGAPVLRQPGRARRQRRPRHRRRGVVADRPGRGQRRRDDQGHRRQGRAHPRQVALRWHIQRGDIVFPKSMNADRMAQNFAIFDFELGAEDMAEITALDRGEAGRLGPNPDAFDYIPG